MKESIAILTIGSEILDGRVQDTNANYLCNELHNAGYTVGQIISCDDDLSEMIAAAAFAAKSNDVLIFSGGIGPTTDDLTREAVAEFVGVELVLNEKALVAIKESYSKRLRAFEPSNEKQALIPAGASLINNHTGTAPGFTCAAKIENKNILIISLPGVPSEMKPMFETEALGLIKAFLPNAEKMQQSAFKVFGIPESVVGARIKALHLPKEVVVSYRAHYPEIHVILKSLSRGLLDSILVQVRSAVGNDYIFTNDIKESLEMSVHNLLLAKNQTIAAAESCSGGMVSSLLTNCAGSSQYFLGSAVSYANRAKTAILNVSAELIEQHGAVSSEVAEQMAANCRAIFKTDLAVSVTGIAGPDGGSESKPVGLFFIGLACAGKVTVHKYLHMSSRGRIRQYAAHMALDLIRRQLSGLAPHPDTPPY